MNDYNLDGINPNMKTVFNRNMFNHNFVALSVDNVRTLIKDKHIWDIPHHFDQFSYISQGQESDSSEDSDEESNKSTIKYINKKSNKTVTLRKTRMLEFFMRKEKLWHRQRNENKNDNIVKLDARILNKNERDAVIDPPENEEFDFVKDCDMSKTYFSLTNESRRPMK